MSYEQELTFATDLARQAGSRMRAGIEDTQTTWKADQTPVTLVDIDINQLVIDAVRRVYPDDGILGEENSYESERDRKWVVDPIDGTQAYDLGAPLSTFCLGLVENGEVKLGVVYEPFMDQLYTGIKGEGSFINGQPLHVSDSDTLDKNYVFISGRVGNMGITSGMLFDRFSETGAKNFSFRSIVYGYMLIAKGRAVSSISGSIYPWDMAAAKVILEEAGAKITNLEGQSIAYDDVRGGVIVTNGRVHGQVLDLIKI